MKYKNFAFLTQVTELKYSMVTYTRQLYWYN